MSSETTSQAKVYTIEDDDEYIYDIGIEFNRDTSSYTINIMQFDKISGRLIHRCDMSINKKGLDHLVNHLMKALLYP